MPKMMRAMTTLALLATAAPSMAQDVAKALPDLGVNVLAVVSDGDQTARSYSTGILGDETRTDRLTLWTTPFDATGTSAGSVEAPNANYSPSGVVVLNTQGTRAYVVETMRRPAGTTQLAQLEPSTLLTAYDISQPRAAKQIASINIGMRPHSLDLSADGKTLVALSNDAERPLAFIPITENGLGEPGFFQIPDRLDGKGFGFVQWSPVDNILAVQFSLDSAVRFLRVTQDGAGRVTTIDPSGDKVITNKYPFIGQFTPDGSHYITSDVNWGPDGAGVTRGVLTMIRVGRGESDIQNRQVDVDITGRSVESFAISPDGQYLIASAMEDTGQPVGHPNFTGLARITIHRIDVERGRLATVGEVQHEARLPQGIVFDRSGKYLFVGTNELADDASRGGVKIFRFDRSPTPTLIDTGIKLYAPPGVHSITVAHP